MIEPCRVQTSSSRKYCLTFSYHFNVGHLSYISKPIIVWVEGRRNAPHPVGIIISLQSQKVLKMSYLFIYLFLWCGRLRRINIWLALPSSIVISKKTFLPYIKQYFSYNLASRDYGSLFQATIVKSVSISAHIFSYLWGGGGVGWVWIKISEHEHDCTAPFPHSTDSVQLHRDAALPWGFKELKAERDPIERCMAPADCWNRAKWRLMEYKWKGSFPGWYVPVQEVVILSWLL